jgi:uncharacterized protein
VAKNNCDINRLSFLRGAAVVGSGAILAPTFLQGLGARLGYATNTGAALPKAGAGEGGDGPLQPTSDQHDGVIRMALPAGFSYVTFGIEGSIMSDGNPTPKAHDGMAAFRLPNGNVRLIRNHELRDNPPFERHRRPNHGLRCCRCGWHDFVGGRSHCRGRPYTCA